MDRDTTVCCAGGVEWWSPITPVFCELVNRGKKVAVIPQDRLIALIIALQTHDSEIFNCLLNMEPLTSDRPGLFSPRTPLPSEDLDHDLPDPGIVIQTSEANYGQLDAQHKEEVSAIFEWHIHQISSPTEPKRVPEVLDSELTLPLIDCGVSPSGGREETHIFSRKVPDGT